MWMEEADKKRPYESGTAKYKHVYFNSTSNTFKIWTLTVISILLLYEAICRLCSLALKKQARYSMFVLFVSSMYPHYYSWWMFFNYWNDEYFSQWSHQLFFSLTELLSTVVALVMADKTISCSTIAMLLVMAIATVHILASAWDQFVLNVLRGEGYSYQVVRDIGFMIPDILHFMIPLRQLKFQQHSKIKQRDYGFFILLVILGTVVTWTL